MNHTHLTTTSKVPFGDKVAFGIGMLANEIRAELERRKKVPEDTPSVTAT